MRTLHVQNQGVRLALRQKPLYLELRTGLENLEAGGFESKSQHLAHAGVVVKDEDATQRFFGLTGGVGVLGKSHCAPVATGSGRPLACGGRGKRAIGLHGIGCRCDVPEQGLGLASEILDVDRTDTAQ